MNIQNYLPRFEDFIQKVIRVLQHSLGEHPVKQVVNRDSCAAVLDVLVQRGSLHQAERDKAEVAQVEVWKRTPEFDTYIVDLILRDAFEAPLLMSFEVLRQFNQGAWTTELPSSPYLSSVTRPEHRIRVLLEHLYPQMEVAAATFKEEGNQLIVKEGPGTSEQWTYKRAAPPMHEDIQIQRFQAIVSNEQSLYDLGIDKVMYLPFYWQIEEVAADKMLHPLTFDYRGKLHDSVVERLNIWANDPTDETAWRVTSCLAWDKLVTVQRKANQYLLKLKRKAYEPALVSNFGQEIVAMWRKILSEHFDTETYCWEVIWNEDQSDNDAKAGCEIHLVLRYQEQAFIVKVI